MWLRRRLGLTLRVAASPSSLVLGAIVVVGLLLRLRHNDYGLPYVYNFDEETHFTNRAVEMFDRGNLDPGYYQNPSNFTYLVHFLLRLRYADLPLIGHIQHLPLPAIGLQFTLDPLPIWVNARSVAAVLGMLGVIAVFFVGKRLFGTWEGLVAAAVLSFAFLPVTYSRIAVTDAGTLVPVALAIYGAIMVHERGDRRWYVLAGVATGLAIGFKYTSGLVLLPLLLAAAMRLRDGDRTAVENTILGVAAMSAVFAVTNPYFFIHLREASSGLLHQAESAGATKKFGQEQSSGFGYYLDTMRWGLGWAPAFAALAGAVLLFRLNRTRALLLVAFPVALFIYMSLQSRFFGRWMLPMYPVLALLCGLALVRLVRVIRLPTLAQGALLALATAAVLAQSVAADVRTTRLLGRQDTRQEARDFLTARFGPHLRIVIEPAVPQLYYSLTRNDVPHHLRPSPCSGMTKLSAHPATSDCLPTTQFQFIARYAKDIRKAVSTIGSTGMTAYAKTLRPVSIDKYRQKGFCLVMTMSVVRGRAENAHDPQALAYYRRIERESRLILHASPYKQGVKPPKFHFDLSYNYYPTAFRRPGPDVRIYQLNRCTQRYGPVAKRASGGGGLDKGVGTTFQGF
jgi:hypothetical protein